ncbi:MAG TPA: response regulator transcription factor [Bryobacteraceae bacterium]|nr:response regulator transcription factor [Bryobacteraceae bacterium]
MNNALGTRLLLVDDDLKLCRLIREYLETLGYTVTTVHTGPDGLQAALAMEYDAVILDVMLPRMDGFEVLRQLRAKSEVPVLMLTGLGEEADRIVGLEIGADDYLPKTFSTRELLARLRAVIRRSKITARKRSAARGDEAEEAVVVGEVRADPASREVTLSGRALPMTAVEFDLLIALARAAGRVKTRERLLLEVAERDFESFDRSIDVHISSIRRKLGDDPRTPQYIQTIRGVGYMMLKPGAGVPG